MVKRIKIDEESARLRARRERAAESRRRSSSIRSFRLTPFCKETWTRHNGDAEKVLVTRETL